MSEPAAQLPDEPIPGSEGWPYWAAGVIDAIRVRPSLKAAADVVGVARTTVQRLQRRDKSFADALAEARDEAVETMEEVARIRATTGQPLTRSTAITVEKVKDDGRVEKTTTTTVTEERHISDVLLMFYIKRWRPEYRESYRVEHSGKDGGPIEIEEKLRDVEDRFAAGVLRLVEPGDADSATG